MLSVLLNPHPRLSRINNATDCDRRSSSLHRLQLLANAAAATPPPSSFLYLDLHVLGEFKRCCTHDYINKSWPSFLFLSARFIHKRALIHQRRGIRNFHLYIFALCEKNPCDFYLNLNLNFSVFRFCVVTRMPNPPRLERLADARQTQACPGRARADGHLAAAPRKVPRAVAAAEGHRSAGRASGQDCRGHQGGLS